MASENSSPRLNSSTETKKTPTNTNNKVSPPTITTRSSARKAKIQTRAMSHNAKPSAALMAAKKKMQRKKRQSLEILVKDYYQTAMNSEKLVRKDVGFVSDPSMIEHKCLWDPNYPECPERLSSVIDRCNELGLLKQCKEFKSRKAEREEVEVLHSPSVYDLMLTTHQNNDLEYLEEVSSRYDAIYIHPTTHELSLLSAGSTIDLVEAVAKGETVGSGVALVRPPGHHAMKSELCGYCIYNNVALAARHVIDTCDVSRVLIVDWDVHHGQATQQMFYNDPRVVYFSIHRYEDGAFWPNLRQSNFNYIGSGKGTGYNFNVPLNKIKMQDADYLAIWHQLLLPMAIEYQPQIVIVSAGYDAAIGCPEGEMEISPACYAHLTHLLMGVCSSIAVVLEGGYCLKSLSEGAALTVRTLLGHPPPNLAPLTKPCESVVETILNCIYAHKKYWNCFNYQPTYTTDPSIVSLSDENKVKHKVEVRWKGDETRPDRFQTRDCYPVQSQQFLDEVDAKLISLKLTTDLSIPEYPVCYVHDDNMLLHRNICEPDHVEKPERLSKITSKIEEWKLKERMLFVEGATALSSDILTTHSKKLFDMIKATDKAPPRDLIQKQQKYDSLYLHPDTFKSATMAVGSVLKVVDKVLQGVARSGVCAIRPPGHHASEDIPSGFCIFNNVAIATKHALSNHSLKRILILDWDVHHGNGTQSIFLDDPRVLFISIHRYDYGTFFPHSTEADYTKIGNGKGRGYNVNIPWNKGGMGDKEYIAAFLHVVLPIAYEFNPELVMVSAGFDACIGDPLGGCKVTPECYGLLTHWLMSLAKGRLILCLEGGYNVRAISYAMAMCTKALLGDPIIHNADSRNPPHPSAVESINNVISVQKKHWHNLAFQIALPKEEVLPVPEPSRGLDAKPAPNDTESNVNTSSDKSKSEDSDTKSIPNDDFVDSITSSIDKLTVKCDGNSANNDKNELPASSSGSHQGFGAEPRVELYQTLSHYLAENYQALLNEEMFAVIPVNWCPHVDGLPQNTTINTFHQGSPCNLCEETMENWVCLDCHVRLCGRFIRGHMAEHFAASEHPLVLSLADLSAWCQVCEAYIDHPNLLHHKRCAHMAKFGEDLPG